MVITFLLGVWAAGRVAMAKSPGCKAVVDGLLTLPMVLPPTVAGFFLLLIFGVKRPLGRMFLEIFGVKLVFSWAAAVITATAISFPLMYRAARGAFEQVDQNLIHAARTLGLGERRIFWAVIMPNAMPGVLSGAILAFARGLGEFGATSMLAGNIAGETRTLPLAIYSEVAAGSFKTAYPYVWIIVAISFAAVAVMNALAAPRGQKGRGKRRIRRFGWLEKDKPGEKGQIKCLIKTLIL